MTDLSKQSVPDLIVVLQARQRRVADRLGELEPYLVEAELLRQEEDLLDKMLVQLGRYDVRQTEVIIDQQFAESRGSDEAGTE
jgi:hypothetical protein